MKCNDCLADRVCHCEVPGDDQMAVVIQELQNLNEAVASLLMLELSRLDGDKAAIKRITRGAFLLESVQELLAKANESEPSGR